MTVDEAQALHEARQAADPSHDLGGSCWCCCWDCDFDFDEVMAASESTNENPPQALLVVESKVV